MAFLFFDVPKIKIITVITMVYINIGILNTPVFNNINSTVSITKDKELYSTIQAYFGSFSTKNETGYITADMYLLRVRLNVKGIGF